MRACSKCGKESPNEFRFCPACASSLPPASVAGERPRETRKLVTVVFSDVTGSTEIGERVDPESLRRMMSFYYGHMREALERHGGSVEKMIGDAVMGVFGVPVLREDDALRAVRAAFDMRERLHEINDEIEERWGVRILARTGVNTGRVLATETVEAFVTGGVTGDSVNVAARLEQAAEPDQILIGELTRDLVRGDVVIESVGALELKGKSEGVPAFRLVGVAPEGTVDPAGTLAAPMVGRDAEMAQLRAAYDRAAGSATARLVTVIGAAGAGKSRLVDEFAARVEGEARLLVGACLPYGEGITYLPIAEAIRDAAGFTPDDDAASMHAKIATVARRGADEEAVEAHLESLVGIGEGTTSPDESLWAVRRLLENLAAEVPVIVVFDDVHWAQSGFLDLVQRLAATPAPVLIVCAARPELLDAHPDWPAEVPDAVRVSVDALSEEDASRLVTSLLRGVPPEAASLLAAAAGGNPLFVEEYLRMLADHGVLRRTGIGWEVRGDLGAIPAPPTISAVLSARIEHLPPERRDAAERASVIGKVFSASAVASLTPEPLRQRVEESLEALVRGELLRREPDELPAGGGEAFGFRHILLRDAAYEALPKEVRATLHERFAAWLEAAATREAGTPAADVEEISGYHLEQAFRYRSDLGPLDGEGRAVGARAAARLGSAGRRAEQRLDAHAAANLLARSAALQEDDAARLALLPGLGRALVDTGDFERAGQVIADAEELSSRLEDADAACHARLARLELDFLVAPDGWNERAEREALEAIEVFERESDDRGLATAWGMLSDVHATRLRSAESLEAARRAIEHARRCGERGGQFHGSYAIQLCFGPTPVGEAIGRCRAMLEHWGIGPGPRAATLWALAGLHAMRGDFEVARAFVEESSSIDRELGRDVILAQSRAEMLGRIGLWEGDHAAAELALREGYDALKALGERTFLSTIAAMLAQALEAQGRADEALALTEESEETAADDDIASQVRWRLARANVLAARGDFEAADALSAEAVALVENADVIDCGEAFLERARVLQVAGRSEEAAAAAAAAADHFASKEATALEMRADALSGGRV